MGLTNGYRMVAGSILSILLSGESDMIECSLLTYYVASIYSEDYG